MWVCARYSFSIFLPFVWCFATCGCFNETWSTVMTSTSITGGKTIDVWVPKSHKKRGWCMAPLFLLSSFSLPPWQVNCIWGKMVKASSLTLLRLSVQVKGLYKPHLLQLYHYKSWLLSSLNHKLVTCEQWAKLTGCCLLFKHTFTLLRESEQAIIIN